MLYYQLLKIKCTFCATGHLVLTDQGETCQERDLAPIGSQVECEASTGFIQKHHENYHFKTSMNNSTFPKGCLVSLSFDAGMDDQGYFNIHSSGAGQKQSIAVCKNSKCKVQRIQDN